MVLLTAITLLIHVNPMPCLNPVVVRNRRYLPSKKNGGVPPLPPDPRLRSIVVPCGKCIECRKRIANDWRFRLHQEYRHNPGRKYHFVTLTFSDSSLDHLKSEYIRLNPDSPTPSLNQLCAFAIRRFLERYRKRYKVSLRHFFITELGGKTERIHLHGIIIDCKAGYWHRSKFYADMATLQDLWKYGYIWLGWCNDKTISYVCKYITKIGPNDTGISFSPAVFVSPGFGKDYVSELTINVHNHGDGGQGIWYVTSSNGYRMAIPRYLRLKLFTESRLLQRSLELLQQPPNYTFKGHTYSCFLTYRKRLYREYRISVSCRSTQLPSPRPIPNLILTENEEFNI